MTRVTYKVGNAIFYNYKDAMDAHSVSNEHIEVLYVPCGDVDCALDILGRKVVEDVVEEDTAEESDYAEEVVSTDRYIVFQNRDSFEFVDDLVEYEEAEAEGDN